MCDDPEHQRIISAAQDVRRACRVTGIDPRHHNRVAVRHRAEWPTLHKAVTRLIQALDKGNV